MLNTKCANPFITIINNTAPICPRIIMQIHAFHNINQKKTQGNRIKIREEKYRIHHADMMFANRSIQICIPEVIKIS